MLKRDELKMLTKTRKGKGKERPRNLIKSKYKFEIPGSEEQIAFKQTSSDFSTMFFGSFKLS